MDHEREIIERQMAETRHALTDKLDQLEQKVADTVSDATQTVEQVRSAVTGTVNTVTESVRETVESVSEALDMSKQVERHPWGMVAGATALGFVGGCLMYSQSESRGPSQAREPAMKPSKTGNGKHGTVSQAVARFAERSPIGKSETWSPIVDKLRGLAVATTLGLVKDLVQRSVPRTLEREVGDVLDGITTALGGHPISGHILPEEDDEAEAYRRHMRGGAAASAAESWERSSRF
jgi:ElaB/YqjD/DUF883 family membrane-anchored ribosome-binding protein